MNMTAHDQDYAVATKPDTVRLERLLPGPAERLWSYLVDADKRSQWFSGGDTLRKDAKGTLLFRHSDFADEPTPEKYREMDGGGITALVEVKAFDPPRLLSYTWPNGAHESEVTFELFPAGKDVRLVITHRRLKDTEEMASVSSGWHAHVDALADVLAGGKPKGFWTNVLKLEGEYAERLGG